MLGRLSSSGIMREDVSGEIMPNMMPKAESGEKASSALDSLFNED